MTYRVTVHNRDELKRHIEQNDWNGAARYAAANDTDEWYDDCRDIVEINGQQLDREETAIVIAALTSYAELNQRKAK